MKSHFDEVNDRRGLREKLWMSRGTPAFWTILETCDDRVHLCAGASKGEIKKLKEYVGGELPPTLEEFLKVSNGLKFEFDPIVLSVDEIIAETTLMHRIKEVLPNDHLLYIGELGDGDTFAFGMTKMGQWEGSVFWCDHETLACYDCALGIYDYVAKHIAWRSADHNGEDPSSLDERRYREKLRKLSGKEGALPGSRALIKRILQKRAKNDWDEIRCIHLLTEFLSQLRINDFREIPIDRLLKK